MTRDELKESLSDRLGYLDGLFLLIAEARGHAAAAAWWATVEAEYAYTARRLEEIEHAERREKHGEE